MSVYIVPAETGGKNSFRFDAVCPTNSGGRVCGSINVVRAIGKIDGRVAWFVNGINVDADRQRQGIGTKLYEAAAAEACRRRGRLASLGRHRNPGAHSHDFWAKQARKGRVTAVRTRGGAGAPTYVVTDCPPPPLDGVKRRWRRR